MRHPKLAVAMRPFAVLFALVLAVLLGAVTQPKAALAVDYTISDAASCLAFVAAIGGTADLTSTELFGQCYLQSGTLNAGDTLKVAAGYTLRPQWSQGKGKDFVNYGTVTVNGALYNAGRVENYGTITINTPDVSNAQNYNLINNYGQFTVTTRFYNGGTFNNNCGGTVTGSGAWTGTAVNQKCGRNK
jgi:hypothetical protein